MRVIIAYGYLEADYIIKRFKQQKGRHRIQAINPSLEVCEYISKENKMSVYHGDPSKVYALDAINAHNAELFISLAQDDCDNFVACLLAKTVYGVKKCICTVKNPRNVEVFKDLGIDAAISSTYQLAEAIKNESSIESMMKTLSIEDDKIVMTEIEVRANYEIANKTIMDINFPLNANISCIYRKPHVIIPRGATVILPKDRLIIVSSPKEQDRIVSFVQKEAKNG